MKVIEKNQKRIHLTDEGDLFTIGIENCQLTTADEFITAFRNKGIKVDDSTEKKIRELFETTNPATSNQSIEKIIMTGRDTTRWGIKNREKGFEETSKAINDAGLEFLDIRTALKALLECSGPIIVTRDPRCNPGADIVDWTFFNIAVPIQGSDVAITIWQQPNCDRDLSFNRMFNEESFVDHIFLKLGDPYFIFQTTHVAMEKLTGSHETLITEEDVLGGRIGATMAWCK